LHIFCLLVLHLRRWLYTCVPVTSTFANSDRSLPTAFRWTSLNPLSVLRPCPTRSEKWCRIKPDMTFVHVSQACPPLACPSTSAAPPSTTFGRSAIPITALQYP